MIGRSWTKAAKTQVRVALSGGVSSAVRVANVRPGVAKRLVCGAKLITKPESAEAPGL